jgi:hypothetical protein
MKKYNKINPIGLKGNQINERMIHLMGIKPINENKNNYVVELTKMGPDGKAYAIVRENHEYYIKVTNKTSNIVAEDFKYIGGLQNKKSEAYSSYAKATKHLNLRFNSLAEAYNYNDDINVLEDDNLLNENAFAAGFSSQGGNGFSGEGNLEGNEEMYKEETVYEYDEKAMQNFIDQYGEERGKQIYYATANKQDRDPETFEKTEGMTSFGDDVELNEFEEAIDEMMARYDEEKFPDLTGDGEVTKADILKGRGVFEEEDEYVDYTMGNEDDPNQLPNPPREINIPEELYGNQGEIESSDLSSLRAMEESIKRLDAMINSLSEGTVKKKVLTIKKK